MDSELSKCELCGAEGAEPRQRKLGAKRARVLCSDGAACIQRVREGHVGAGLKKSLVQSCLAYGLDMKPLKGS